MPLALITGGDGDLAGCTAAALEAEGLEVLAPGRDQLDVADSRSVAAYFDGLDAGIDLLVNNAGMIRDAPCARMGAADFDAVLAVNLGGAFRCSRRAMARMAAAGGGHIVNVGSYSALAGAAGQANYAAAKAGLVALTQSLAREGGARGVRANAVLPGFLDTKMTAALAPDVRARAIDEHVLGRFNTAESAARFIAFLHAHQPAVSGQTFQLDSRIRRWT